MTNTLALAHSHSLQLSQKKDSNANGEAGGSISRQSSLGYLSRLNSFTLNSGSSLHFELSSDPSELIGAIFWQLKRIKIEKYEPFQIESKDEDGNVNQSSENHSISSTKENSHAIDSVSPLVSKTPNFLDEHNFPIARMGDIDSYLRQKYDIDANSTRGGAQGPLAVYLRDPKLTDEENALLFRPYCGNPFIAPGTIGSRSRGGSPDTRHMVEGSMMQDEGAYFGLSDEETIMP